MVKRHLTIGHLYPHEMNIYGDTGNVLVIKKRLEWRDIAVRVKKIGIGQSLPSDIDILISGGGQDQGQIKVQADLAEKSARLHQMADEGVVMLVICGTYQLFGKRFITNKRQVVNGIGIFDMETVAGDERLIGNIVVQSDWGELVGYENHSGKSYLKDTNKALGTVISGAGNNGADGSEGAVENNVFGSYLHGPLLPKNPQLADELIARALLRKYDSGELKELNDVIAHEASSRARERPR